MTTATLETGETSFKEYLPSLGQAAVGIALMAGAAYAGYRYGVSKGEAKGYTNGFSAGQASLPAPGVL